MEFFLLFSKGHLINVNLNLIEWKDLYLQISKSKSFLCLIFIFYFLKNEDMLWTLHAVTEGPQEENHQAQLR